MRKKFKKTLSAVICIGSIFAGATFLGNFCHAKNSQKNEAETKKQEESFDFIKSDDKISEIIYDGSVLLYGGIALISISAAGIIFTFLPSRRKNRKQ